jgi:hypothetical protein
VDRDFVSGLEQSACHAKTHIAETDESDSHDLLLTELDHETK